MQSVFHFHTVRLKSFPIQKEHHIPKEKSAKLRVITLKNIPHKIPCKKDHPLSDPLGNSNYIRLLRVGRQQQEKTHSREGFLHSNFHSKDKMEKFCNEIGKTHSYNEINNDYPEKFENFVCPCGGYLDDLEKGDDKSEDYAAESFAFFSLRIFFHTPSIPMNIKMYI